MGWPLRITYAGAHSHVTSRGNDEVMASHLDGKQVERDVPAIQELSKSRKIEIILEKVRGILGDARLEQKVGIYLAHRYSGARLKELSLYFDKKDTAIAQED